MVHRSWAQTCDLVLVSLSCRNTNLVREHPRCMSNHVLLLLCIFLITHREGDRQQTLNHKMFHPGYVLDRVPTWLVLCVRVDCFQWSVNHRSNQRVRDHFKDASKLPQKLGPAPGKPYIKHSDPIIKQGAELPRRDPCWYLMTWGSEQRVQKINTPVFMKLPLTLLADSQGSFINGANV